MVELPHAFLERMRSALGGAFGDFVSSYETPPARAIRVNTLKIGAEEFAKISPFGLSPVGWEPDGFYVDGEGLGKTVLHAAGAYYVQEPSAMAVVPAMGIKKGDRVLDLCSAPGGKGTQIASRLGGTGVLVLNEPVPSRRDVLARNAERLGLKGAAISCADPSELSAAFGCYFDKILVDAPCSGEGMFKKEPNAIPEWSYENVLMCAARQKRILAEADKMLCGGGRLVYSTCTFSPEEDELQVEAFLSSHPAYTLIEMKKLYPHEVRGEGHFYSVLEKGDGDRAEEFPPFSPSYRPADIRSYREWESRTLLRPLENLVQAGDMLFTYYGGERNFNMRTVRQTVFVGRTDGKIFTPAHAFAARLSRGAANGIELDEHDALEYLRGRTFPCPQQLKGWYLATYCGLPLGWCKASGGVAKNHYPKGLRI